MAVDYHKRPHGQSGVAGDAQRCGKPTSAARREWRAATGIGLVTGALLCLAYPSTGWWPLAIGGWVPLLYWIEVRQPRWQLALLAGWVAGVVLHAVVYAFLAFTAVEMSSMPWAAGYGLVGLHAAAMALHQGLFAAVTAWTRRSGCPLALRAAQVAVTIAVCEFALPWLFRWYVANAFFRTPLWMQAADLVGVIGVSALALAVAQLVAMALARRSMRPAVGAAVVAAAWAGYGALRMHQVAAHPATGTWRAALVQQNATLGEKKAIAAEKRVTVLDRLLEMSEDALRQGRLADRDALIWPEGAFPFFWVPDEVGPAAPKIKTKANHWLLRSKERVIAWSRRLPMPLLLGTLRRFDPLWVQEARNSAIVLDRGRQTFAYDKQILLAFGEYLPGTRWFPALKEAIPGVSNFDEGTTSGLVQLGRGKVLVNICYEALFAEFLRDEAGDAQVLVNLTNDVWFGPQPAPDLHLMVQQARAVELRRPLVRSTVSGVSAYIDAAGVFQSETQVGRAETVLVDVPLRDLASPYRLWGDVPLWLTTVGCAAWLARLGWRRRRAPLPSAALAP
ncbi:MAG: apolipoprotein N-acyltransferase [Deltaproteobacteria bacterium]|nr:apolipoprotein N-acyltransferase [Deltaproteobacteria bacterium]